MSDIARFWSRHLHGLNFAEHAICRELAEHHVAETNLCYPNMATLCDIYECSRPYLKKILNRLDTWNLVTRIEWFDKEDKNRQTSNRYRLNLSRHFPDPPNEKRTTKDKNKAQTARPYDNRDIAALTGAIQGRKILNIMGINLPARHQGLKAGLPEAFLQKETKTLWVCVQSEAHMSDFLDLLPDLAKIARTESHQEFEIVPVELYFRPKKHKRK